MLKISNVENPSHTYFLIFNTVFFDHHRVFRLVTILAPIEI